MKLLDVVLHSDFSSGTCLAMLAEQIDIDQLTLFSLSGYRGKRPFLGRIAGNEFRLHKRRYWHNSFGPVLYGRVTSNGQGTTIEAYWDMLGGTIISVQVWIVFSVLIGTPMFIKSLMQLLSGKTNGGGGFWVGLVVPPTIILLGLLIPQLGALLSFHERKDVLGLLERTLVAGPSPVENMERNWRSSLA